MIPEKPTTASIGKKMETMDLTTLEKPSINKGSRGQKLERNLDLTNNSELLDLKDGDLKSSTLGESQAVTLLSHCLPDIIDKNTHFRETKVGIKLKNQVICIFDKEGDHLCNKTSLDYGGFGEEFIQDYDFIASEIRGAYHNNEQLKTINGPNKYLQIRTKASKNKAGGYTPLMYNGVQLKDKGMAFYLTAKFLKEKFAK